MTNILITGHRKRDPVSGQFVSTNKQLWDGGNWDDGWTDRKGYFHVYRPDHPNSNESGFIFRYHVVWWLATGEVILHPMVLHHKNEVKTDGRLENLEKMYSGDHAAMHSAKSGIHCICTQCGEVFWLPQWRINQGRGKFCSIECYWDYPVSIELKQKRLAASMKAREL